MKMHLDYAAFERRRWEGSDAGIHDLALSTLSLFYVHSFVTTLNNFAKLLIFAAFPAHQKFTHLKQLYKSALALTL